VRRAAAAAAGLAAALALAADAAGTSSSSVPTSVAAHRATTVTGATMTSLSYTVVGDSITTVTARLRGVGLLGKTVRAGFGAGPSVICTAGVLTVLDVVTGLGEADYTCTGLLEDADRPRSLLITAS